MESREQSLANVAVYLLFTKEWRITLALRSIIAEPGVPWVRFMNQNGAVVVSFDEVIPLACVASVSTRGLSRKLGQEQKK